MSIGTKMRESMLADQSRELYRLRARVAELEEWIKVVMERVPGYDFPGDLDLYILDRKEPGDGLPFPR